MVVEATNITISFPNWFYCIFSIGVLALVFSAGIQWKKVREICAEFPKIRRALDIISQLLLSHKWVGESVYVSAQSPVKLTDAGKKMLEASKFEEFFTANKNVFFENIAAERPKTESEVEAAARSTMLYLDTKTTPKMELVEDFAYSIGKPVADILFAYSIEIRDRYLKERFQRSQVK